MPAHCSFRLPRLVIACLVATLLTACTGVGSPPAAEGYHQLVERWRQRAGVAAVAAAVAVPDRPVQVMTSGSPARDGTESVPADAPFRIASLTKTLVATVVLQLVAEGRLGLDEPVRSYLPAGPPGATVRQLLNHTSGLPDHQRLDGEVVRRLLGRAGHDSGPVRVQGWVDGLLADRDRVWTPGELLALVGTYKPDFPPGTRYAYSNTNYVLLGELIRAVTGRPWSAELRVRVLDPLNLSQTWVAGAEPARGRIMPGYADVDGDGDKEDVETGGPWPSLESSEGAAGAVVSTAGDLARFGAALFRGRVLPPALLEQMVTPSRFGARNDGYGLGVEVRRPDYRTTVWGSRGFLPGFRAALRYQPADDVVVVVLVSDSMADAADLAELLARAAQRTRTA